MLPIRYIELIFSVMLIVVSMGVVLGETFPNKPIRILTSEVGGTSDLSARIIAQGISGPLGQPVIVENRPANVIGEMLARANPDGYTIVFGGSVLLSDPLIQKTSYNPLKDFSPITAVTATPLILLVHPAVAVNSARELIALAKARPGELNYASGPVGGATHFATELFKAMAGVNIVRVPYKGAGPALNALVAGETQLMINNAIQAMPQVKSNKLKALAVTSANPSAVAPGLPTIAASGLPGYEYITLIGVFAPAKTPSGIINRLNQEIVRVLNRADVKERYLSTGAEVVANSSAQFAAAIKADIAKWGKMVKDADIRPDY